MVHALREICRVLIATGILIDLRPLAAEWPVEVVSARERKLAGEVTDLPQGLADDAAANHAISQAATDGLLRREEEEIFPFHYYWDSPGDMRTYVEEEWSDFISIEESVWNNVRSYWAVANADARVRIQLSMLITRWRKLS
jgi:hypothetical protein